MRDGDRFTKLYGSILRSTLMLEPPEVRLVFLLMLAAVEWDGMVEAPSVRVLAHTLNLPADYVQRALDVLEAPDPESRTPDHGGRRVLRTENGWRIVNYAKYRETRTPKQLADAERQRRHRGSVTERDTRDMSHSSRDVATDLRSQILDSDQDPDQKKKKRARAPKAPRPTKWTRFPASYVPSEADRQLAVERGKDCDHELAQIRDHEFAKPKTDPAAAFRYWLRNDFSRTAAPKRGPAPVSDASEHAADAQNNLRWLSGARP